MFSNFQCGFRKNFDAQHCLLLMIDKWKKAADNIKDFDTFLTDLSKNFYCICYDLLTVKLHAYGFENDSSLSPELKTKNKIWIFIQHVGENNSGVPQKLFLFNIFLHDLVLEHEGYFSLIMQTIYSLFSCN